MQTEMWTGCGAVRWISLGLCVGLFLKEQVCRVDKDRSSSQNGQQVQHVPINIIISFLMKHYSLDLFRKEHSLCRNYMFQFYLKTPVFNLTHPLFTP